jgi:hypothetical protein
MKRVLFLAIVCLASLVFWAGGAWAAEFCVYPGGVDEHDLQTALNTAQFNGEDDVIMVVQRTSYSGHFTYYSDEGHSITLAGGYTAGCAGRVVNPANTVLDGAHTGRVLGIGNNAGNIQVDGFTIRNGSLTGESGGGVFASTYSASGTAGTITLLNNTITGNTSTGAGGVDAESSSDSGTAGNVYLGNNIITGNSATNGYGGGGYIQTYSATGTGGTVTLLNNTITGNTATGSSGGGGGFYVATHSGVGIADAGTVSFTDNTIQGNTAYVGGGVYAVTSSESGTAGTVTFTNNTIAGNSASSFYGGVAAASLSTSGTGGTVTITNNTITGNTAGTFGGGLFLSKAGNTINCYNNICWGNTEADIYVNGTGTAHGYNNDYTNMTGSWDNSDVSNIDADPLFVDPGYWNDNGTPSDPSDDFWVDGDYHLRPASPCIDTGLNSAPGIPAQDFEGDDRVFDGDSNGTASVDMGADEYIGSVILEAPADGTIYDACTLINKYQPAFQWLALEPFKTFTILFSISPTDFLTKGVLITKANIKGTKFSYTPSSGTWKKIMTASYNGGSIRPIYWKVMGKRADKSIVESAVWNVSIDVPLPPVIQSPLEAAELPAATPPTFIFYTNCNIKFRLEISPLVGFTDPKQIKAFTYSVKDPNITTTFSKTLSSGQWKAVQKLITGTGYFRIRAWDKIKRETHSETRSFTITP